MNASLKELTKPDKTKPPPLDEFESKRVKLDVSKQNMTVGKATFNILGSVEEESPSVRSFAGDSSVTNSDAVFLTQAEDHTTKHDKNKFPIINKPTRGILNNNISKRKTRNAEIQRAHTRNVETTISQKKSPRTSRLKHNTSRHKLDKYLTKDQSFEQLNLSPQKMRSLEKSLETLAGNNRMSRQSLKTIGDISLLLEQCTPTGKHQCQFVEKQKEQKRIDDVLKENEELGERNKEFLQCISRAQVKFNHDIEAH